MIGISKLYCGTVEPSDALRYGRRAKDLPSHLLQFSADKKPVVVWNCTRRCNLRCVHCYSQSEDRDYEDELTTAEARTMIDDLAAFGAPVLLFSGGEPTVRKDLLELVRYAVGKGLRAVISTNGTLIDDAKAAAFAEIGLSYVGISLDGLREVHDVMGIESVADDAPQARDAQDSLHDLLPKAVAPAGILAVISGSATRVPLRSTASSPRGRPRGTPPRSHGP